MKWLTFSFSPKQSLVFVTVFLLIGLGSAYFFWYVPANQSNLEQKQFRCLQTLERNVRDKVDNSLSLLNSLVDDYLADNKDYTAVQVHDYIDHYPTDNFRLLISPAAKAPAKPKTNEKSVQASPAKTAQAAAPLSKVTSDTTFSLTAEGLVIRLRRKGAVIEIHYTPAQFIGPLLRQDIFDHYLVLKQPAVIYQTFPSGISAIPSDSLKTEKSTFSRNVVKNINLSGTAYKLFSHLISLQPGCDLTVAGLLTKAHYDEEKKQLPATAELMLFIVALAVILALPWIKLYQIGSQDRLTASDGILSLAVPMLLMSILFFTFLQYNMRLHDGKDGFDAGANFMSGQVDIRFRNEIHETYDFLRAADSAINAGPAAKPGSQAHSGFPASVNQRLCRADSNLRITQLFQLNAGGKEIRNWSATGATPPGDYSNRSYFTRLKAGDPFYLDDEYRQPYILEPVIARTTGTFTTVMCIRSLKNPGTYTAVSFDMRCLSAPLLTPGFQLALINNDGRVLYHSDAAKQLNENLFEEFTAHETLSAAVHAGQDSSFTTQYSGKEYKAHTLPVFGLPFTIVVMENLSMTQTRLNNQFYFSFLMMFAYFFILGLELVIVFAVSIKPAYYKKHYFDVSWIGPDERFRQDYNLSFYGNLLVMVILPVCWYWLKPGFIELLFIFLSAASLSYIFQNSLYAWRYFQSADSRFPSKRNSVWFLCGTLPSFDAIAYFICPIGSLILVQFLLILALAVLSVRIIRNTTLGWADRLGKKDFSVSFSLMTFSRLIITSGLPVVFFFLAIYNYDIKLVTRYRQNGFINQLLARGVQQQSGLDKVTVYHDGVWVNWYGFDGLHPPAGRQTDNDANTIDLFHRLTMNNDGLLPDISGLDKVPADSSRAYSNIFDTGAGQSWYRLPDGHFLRAMSAPLQYNMPLPWSSPKGFLFWVLVLAGLAGFWRLFHDVIRRLFALNLPLDKGWPTIDKVILQTNPLNKLIFLIGTPGSGKLAHVKKLIDGQLLKDDQGKQLAYRKLPHMDANCLIADMILIPNGDGADNGMADWLAMKKKTMNKRFKLIIINQFEYDIKNPDSNRAKLTLLEDLLQNNAAKVIIISTVHPVNFLDSLNQQSAAHPPVATTPNATPEHDLERWHVLLGHFKIVIQPLKNLAPGLTDTADTDSALRYETRSGAMLNEMYAPLYYRQQLYKSGVTAGSLTLKLGITAHYFYMYIWQSLTKEEKFLLYDLAEDGIVNPFDDYNLILLISKGLVVRQNGQLRLFNQGFRDFIMTAIGQSEALQIQKEIKDNGNWSKMKTPLLLLIAALLMFLFTSQKDSYTDVLKYVAVVTGGVPLIMQLFNLIKPANSNAKTT